MAKRKLRGRLGQAARHDQEPDPAGIVVVALFPVVTIALIGMLQDTTIAIIVAIIGAVTAIALPPSRAR